MVSADPGRPDPDELLAAVQRDAARSRRGRLKIWLGAAPGVGKTFAMLSGAQRLRSQGVDVVIGLVETHGRAETQRLLEGIEVIPRRLVEYRGATLSELDLDGVFARKPALALVDELAHTNAPGSRFEKRWQDVRILLDAGIDVHTTLNVQHVESLNDVVARATGVQVRETVPDAVLDEVDEIELVDLTPDALLERLRAGKVYLPEAARAAATSFFQRNNLAVLRELALRKVAQLVDRRRREDRHAGGERRLRTASERLLVCVGPSPFSARLVRAAHRMAAVVRGELFAVYVAPPGGGALDAASRERVLQNLRVAETLGARTVTLEGRDPAATLLAFAAGHDISRIVVGKTQRSRLQDALFGSFTMEVIRGSRDADVYVISASEVDENGAGAAVEPASGAGVEVPHLRDFTEALGISAASVGLAWLLYSGPDLSTEAMALMLGSRRRPRWHCGQLARHRRLGVHWSGRWPSTSCCTEPRFTFADRRRPPICSRSRRCSFVGVTAGSAVVARDPRTRRGRPRNAARPMITALHSLTRELADAARPPTHSRPRDRRPSPARPRARQTSPSSSPRDDAARSTVAALVATHGGTAAGSAPANAGRRPLVPGAQCKAAGARHAATCPARAPCSSRLRSPPRQGGGARRAPAGRRTPR
jgi:nucleotide-binding universal stress UspA family protein